MVNPPKGRRRLGLIDTWGAGVDLVSSGSWGRRATFTLMYLAYAGIGVGQVYSPSPSAAGQLGWWLWLWTGMFIVGGLLAAFGCLARRWIPEVLAQVALAFPFVSWAIALIQLRSEQAWAFSCWCLVMVCIATIRAMDTWWLATRGAPK